MSSPSWGPLLFKSLGKLERPLYLGRNHRAL